MDVQIPSLMPTSSRPNSSKNYAYWADYLADNYRQIGYRSYVHFLMVHGVRREARRVDLYASFAVQPRLSAAHGIDGWRRFPVSAAGTAHPRRRRA